MRWAFGLRSTSESRLRLFRISGEGVTEPGLPEAAAPTGHARLKRDLLGQTEDTTRATIGRTDRCGAPSRGAAGVGAPRPPTPGNALCYRRRAARPGARAKEASCSSSFGSTTSAR